MKQQLIGLLALSVLAGCSICSSSASATSNITYQETIDQEFTINPSINVSLSSSSLVINDLMPGSNADSNEITVRVFSNNVTGYILNSSVGSSDNPYSSYDRNLVNASSNNAIFSSIDYDSSLSSLTTPSTWGYSYSTTNTGDSNNPIWSDWSSYSGLPLYSDTTHITTLKTNSGPSAATGDILGFKIAAYADSQQPSGEYTNIINFTVVGNATPTTLYQAFYEASKANPSITQKNGYYKMQDMSPEICSAVTEIESQMQLIDTRDDNVYTIAKLKDNRCWMTTNLDLKGGTQLSSDDTDMSSDWILPTANGFQSGNRLPASKVIVSGTTLNDGFLYIDQADIFNSNNKECSLTSPCYSYYSWTAATLGSGLTISTDNTGAPYSVCPKNWHLPDISGDFGLDTDFKSLVVALGGSSSILKYDDSTIPAGATISNILSSSPSNFTLTGSCNSRRFYGKGEHGAYWASTSYSDSRSRSLLLRPDLTDLTNDGSRTNGFSIRCIANN